jgi:hypothetical protein
MSTKLVDKEREFVDGLMADTGQDLGQWMAAIRASGRTERNDIIDWLRLRGFTFSSASWLERIHHNGGRLIYGDAGPRSPRGGGRAEVVGRGVATPPLGGGPRPGIAPYAGPYVPRPPAPQPPPPSAPPPRTLPHTPRAAPAASQPPAPPAVAPPPVTPATAARPPTPAPRSPAPTSGVASDADIDAAIAGAKAYRPLGHAVRRDILGLAPAAESRVVGSLVTFELDRPFAAFAATPKGVRLHVLDGPSTPVTAQRAKAGSGPLAALTVCFMLTDARQLDAVLHKVVADAVRAASDEGP